MARKSIVLSRINELFASGVTDFEKISGTLTTEGIKFSPASLKTQLSKLRKASGIVTTPGQRKFRRVPTQQEIEEENVSGPISLVRWEQEEFKGTGKDRHMVHRFVVCLRLPDGTKYIRLIPIESSGLTIYRIEKSHERNIKTLQDPATEKTIEQFRGIATRLGCTIQAGRYIGLPEGSSKPWLDNPSPLEVIQE